MKNILWVVGFISLFCGPVYSAQQFPVEYIDTRAVIYQKFVDNDTELYARALSRGKAWNILEDYDLGDMVTDSGKLYISLQNTNVGNLVSDGVWWIEATGGSGATTFLALTDTPATYTADYWIKVNSSGTALEFVLAPTGTLPSALDKQVLQSVGVDNYESTSSLSGLLYSMSGSITNLLFNTDDLFLDDSSTDSNHVLSAFKIIALDLLKASLTGADFTGPVTAPIYVLVKSTNYSLTATEANGSLTIATATMSLDLPDAVLGYSGCLMAGQNLAASVGITIDASDYIVVDGIRGALGAGLASTGALGDKICFASDSTDWYVTSSKGF